MKPGGGLGRLFLAEEVLQHFAGRVVRERVDELDVRRHFVRGERFARERAHIVLRQRRHAYDDVRLHLLTEQRVIDADHRDLGDVGMLDQTGSRSRPG